LAVIEMRDVHKRYRIYRERYRSLKEVVINRRFGEWEDRWALRGLDLDVEPGITLGLIGHNGAGKSTTLKLMARVLSPDRGTVRLRGRLSGLLELGAGFQLEYTGRENVYLNASLLGMSKRDVDRRFGEIVSFAELEDYIDAPLRTYSSGMYMRLGFSVAIHVEPEILLVDEVLAVGDEAFQRKCIDWFEGFQRAGGTIVMVSHALGVINKLCDRAAWMGDGRLLALDRPEPVISSYLANVREQRWLAAEADHAAHPEAGPPAIQLAEVRLLDRNGRVVDGLRRGDSLELQIGYRCHQPLKTPVFGVAIYRDGGGYVYGTNTAVDGFPIGPIDRNGILRLKYHSLPLLGGTYVITVAIFASAEPHAGAIDYREQYYRFRILDETGEQGLARLEHDWSLAVDPMEERRVG
jgi:ABC-type polysaccharide/polyol phosphate transport system ATPase subunit